MVLIAVLLQAKYNADSLLKFPILKPFLKLDFDRSVGLTYKVFYINPPYTQLHQIGITVPLDTPVTTSYVNVSVILLLMCQSQKDYEIVSVRHFQSHVMLQSNGNIHNLIHPLPVYVRDNLLSIVVVSPLAHNISEAVPADLINFVAVTLPSQVNYYG
ncbi:MAG: hypothetical protein EZS28_051589 [Streblomastix strix]|uniref:Uncharacterized protein n=1 Tax=Streblomastix strix TaxID=222440 RepID=A0A5J4T3G9_9EUKA|nr:MAG: hypothetical protein EZS28_051589 [Streblomastix strix]